jgi:hypothetical protein
LVLTLSFHFSSPQKVKIAALYTDKKEKKIFLIYKEIEMGAVAKSYMRKGFLVYEELRKYLVKSEEAVSHTYMTLQPLPSECSGYVRKI